MALEDAVEGHQRPKVDRYSGFCGRNVPYPGCDRVRGWFGSIALVVALAGGLWFYVRRRGWL